MLEIAIDIARQLYIYNLIVMLSPVTNPGFKRTTMSETLFKLVF